MKKKLLRKFFILVIILLFCYVLSTNSYAFEDPDNYSELYKQYLQLSDEEKEKVSVIPEKYKVSLKELKRDNDIKLSNALLPERYNLADYYDIKVENQGAEGNCWTFASIETLETYLQLHGYGTFDFSENHLNYIESDLFSETEANRGINTEGSYTFFQEYLMHKYGPVSEQEYPYYESEGKHKDYSQSELDGLLEVTPLAYVGDYVAFPNIDKELNDYSDDELSDFREQVKQHIMEKGALYTSVIAPTYFTGEYYDSRTSSAFFPTTTDYRFWEYRHTVAIIGWDDNYSKENFLEESRPQHDGAYIALNSWGKEFGDNGLYYISYDDVFVEKQLMGIDEAATDISMLKNAKEFHINDTNLYNALKNNLGRKISEYNDNEQTITMVSSVLNEITYLDLSDNNITDLSGIENFTNLNNLQLEYNNITSIHELLPLHNLKVLNLNHNNLNTISDDIKDSDFIQLSLNYNPIQDFSKLQEAKSILGLELEGTPITENDLIYLNNLKITSLNLSNTSVKDYSALNDLEDEYACLQILNISNNNDIVYESIPDVSSLDLSYTTLDEEKFQRIPSKSNMVNLNIEYTNIKDLSILPAEQLEMINISGNKNIENISVIKNVDSIIYKDGGISEISLFQDFTTSELNLSSNDIIDYSAIVNNEYIRVLDLSYNKITEAKYTETIRVMIDGNYIKPSPDMPYGIVSILKQTYTDTLTVDPSRDNNFYEIAVELRELHNMGNELEVTNAVVDYDNNMFKIEDCDKDVIIQFSKGKFEGSTITYKLEKVENSPIEYIYIDRRKINDMYVEGDSINPDDLKVYAYYDNDSFCQITDFDLDGGENLNAGENYITISYDDFEDYFTVTAIPRDNVVELNFESKDIYNSVLNKIKEIEEIRFEYPDDYENVKILVSKDDSTKTIKMLKSELTYVAYLGVISDDLINLDDIKQLEGLCGMSLNGKNIEDISAFKKTKEMLDSREDLMEYEKFIELALKNNDKILDIEDDIYRSLELNNTKIENINNLTNLKTIRYYGNKIPEFEEIIDNLRTIVIDVTEEMDNVNKDENGNIILPEIFKVFKDKEFDITANIYDQLRDEEYLNPYNSKEISVKELEDNLIIDYEDLKNEDYDGKNQFIEIRIIDKDYIYADFDIRYRLDYRIFESLELESEETIEVEEGTVPDLSDLVVYKVYSNKQKEQISDFDYSKNPVTNDMQEIEISYTENGITNSLTIPVNVTEHIHEWGEWEVTKEPTEYEEGIKERVCTKNENHKEIARIDKLPETQYIIIEGENQTIKSDTKRNLIIKINADYSVFENGGKVYVDGELLKESNYYSRAGSTIIELKSEYLNTLDEGEHILKVAFYDGKEVSTSFTITNKSEENTEKSKTKKSNNPETNDNIAMWISILILSTIGIIGIEKLFMENGLT